MATAQKKNPQALFRKAMLDREKRLLPRHREREGGSMFPFLTFFLWLSFIGVAVYTIFFSPLLQVTTIEVQGESILPLSEYQSTIERMVQGMYGGILPKNNLLLVGPDTLETALLERYPKLSHVSIERSFPMTVRVSVSEAPYLFRWCSGGPCYGVRNGRAVSALAMEDTRYDTVRLSVIDLSARPVSIGTELSVASYFETFGFLWARFPELLGTNIKEDATTPSIHAEELVLSTGEGWRVFVATDRPAELSLRALQIFFEEYKKDHVDRGGLDWVDLRIEGKIFYADKNEEQRSVEKPIEDKE